MKLQISVWREAGSLVPVNVHNRTNMTPQQIQLVTENFELIKPWADAVATTFYKRLFELDPSLRDMFPSNMADQGRKLMQMLGAAIGMLNRPAALVQVLNGLGQRHAGYGVRDEHYETVGAALLWTLEYGLGPTFTPEAREAWTALYQFVASTMQAAAKVEEPAVVA
jgi:hemoglobin-like flavoprotein